MDVISLPGGAHWIKLNIRECREDSQSVGAFQSRWPKRVTAVLHSLCGEPLIMTRLWYAVLNPNLWKKPSYCSFNITINVIRDERDEHLGYILLTSSAFTLTRLGVLCLEVTIVVLFGAVKLCRGAFTIRSCNDYTYSGLRYDAEPLPSDPVMIIHIVG